MNIWKEQSTQKEKHHDDAAHGSNPGCFVPEGRQRGMLLAFDQPRMVGTCLVGSPVAVARRLAAQRLGGGLTGRLRIAFATAQAGSLLLGRSAHKGGGSFSRSDPVAPQTSITGMDAR